MRLLIVMLLMLAGCSMATAPGADTIQNLSNPTTGCYKAFINGSSGVIGGHGQIEICRGDLEIIKIILKDMERNP